VASISSLQPFEGLVLVAAPRVGPVGASGLKVLSCDLFDLRVAALADLPAMTFLSKIAVSPRLEIRAGVHSPDRPMNASPFDLIIGTMIQTKSILRYVVQVR
jgi:hypothetical protein